MMAWVARLAVNFNYTAAVILFMIGLYITVAKRNLIKKFIGLNIMESSVFLLVVSGGAVRGGRVPILPAPPGAQFVNPLPQALILTGIVVSVSTTALALALMVRIYEHCGTLDSEKLKEVE